MSDLTKRNPFATAHDFMGGVKTSFEISRDNDRPADERPIRITFSVGGGRGNAKPEMTGVEFEELAGLLCNHAVIELSLQIDEVREQTAIRIAQIRGIQEGREKKAKAIGNAIDLVMIVLPMDNEEANDAVPNLHAMRSERR